MDTVFWTNLDLNKKEKRSPDSHGASCSLAPWSRSQFVLLNGLSIFYSNLTALDPSLTTLTVNKSNIFPVTWRRSFMAKMAAESVTVSVQRAPFSSKWQASRRNKLHTQVRASQSMDDKNKVFKELGLSPYAFPLLILSQFLIRMVEPPFFSWLFVFPLSKFWNGCYPSAKSNCFKCRNITYYCANPFWMFKFENG